MSQKPSQVPFLPYVGITDFTNEYQVCKMLQSLQESMSKDVIPRRLHVGVMMSYKTLNGHPTKWAGVFPTRDEIRGVFGANVPSGQVMNCLHYADGKNIEVCKSLVKALDVSGECTNALQLDMTWPDPAFVLEAVKASGLDLEVILQIGGPAFAEICDSPELLVQRLEKYQGVIQHVLLDRSMGRGLPLDAQELLRYAVAIREKFPRLGIAVAGGLGPDTVMAIDPIVREIPDLSIDAQGKLRPNGNAMFPIDWNLAYLYVQDAAKVIFNASRSVPA